MLPFVAFAVAQQFRRPEFDIGFGTGKGLTVLVGMPEAAVDEHDGAPFGQDHVGVSRVAFVVFAKSQTPREEVFADKHLNCRVFAADV